MTCGGTLQRQNPDAPFAGAPAVKCDAAAVGRPREFFGVAIRENTLGRTRGQVEEPRSASPDLKNHVRTIRRNGRRAHEPAGNRALILARSAAIDVEDEEAILV